VKIHWPPIHILGCLSWSLQSPKNSCHVSFPSSTDIPIITTICFILFLWCHVITINPISCHQGFWQKVPTVSSSTTALSTPITSMSPQNLIFFYINLPVFHHTNATELSVSLSHSSHRHPNVRIHTSRCCVDSRHAVCTAEFSCNGIIMQLTL